MDELKVENVPLHVIPVTEYDPFEVCVITLAIVLIELKLSLCSYKTTRDSIASGK